ncbi:hypothetical protein QSH57_004898 [Fusarium oxysporum f. sp. vasinfectum]|nr:hypothetical protein QSH57_004898 [Fusarium oxysporum f. sp. vasinfectum]
MASTTRSTQQVPGLNCPLTKDHVERSRKMYNSLPEHTKRSSIEGHLPAFQHMFVQYGVTNKLGIHLRHGHFKLPENHILVGTSVSKPLCRWARTQHFDNINLHSVHGHIFALDDSGQLHPYEFHEANYQEAIPADFLDAFVKYINDNGLQTEAGLQILLPEFKDQCMSEIPFTDQTIMLDIKHLNGLKPGTVTGWTFSLTECTAGEMHAETGDGHEKVNVGAPLPDNVHGLCRILIDRGALSPDCVGA